ESGRRRQRLDAQLDEVGCVFVVAGAARIVIGAGGSREQVATGGVAAGRVHRVRWVGHELGAVIVIHIALIDELALPVGAGSRDEDRRSVPDRAAFVFELRGAGGAFIQDGRAGTRGRAFFGRERRRGGGQRLGRRAQHR